MTLTRLLAQHEHRRLSALQAAAELRSTAPYSQEIQAFFQIPTLQERIRARYPGYDQLLRPPSINPTDVAQRLGQVSVFGELKLSSDREDSNLAFTGRDVLAGYGLLNLGLNWKINKDLSLLARLNNLTDTAYVLANGYSTPGRNAFVSLSWSM